MASRSTAATVLVLTLATLRLTRFITKDYLGEWLIAKPARRWANEPEMLFTPAERQELPDGFDLGDYAVEPQNGPRSKLVKGLDCPWCVGFWLGMALLIGSATVGKVPVAGTIWRMLLRALALNMVVGTVASRLDD